MVTAYDYPGAKAASAAGCDILLVGDSVGMVRTGSPRGDVLAAVPGIPTHACPSALALATVVSAALVYCALFFWFLFLFFLGVWHRM